MYPSTMQPLCTHVNQLVTSNFQICFPAPYLSLHAKYEGLDGGGGGGGGGGVWYSLFIKNLAHYSSH